MINYIGLRKRPQFEQIVNYLEVGQETIAYPDRMAKQFRNHPYLTQLDGIENRIWEEQEKQKRIRKLAETSTQTAAQLRTTKMGDVGSDFGSAKSDAGVADAETQASVATRDGEAQARTDATTRGTDARARADTTTRGTDAHDVAMQEAKEEIRQMKLERDSALREKVARNLGQPSGDLGTIPFIDSAAAAASSSSSPAAPKRETKTLKEEQTAPAFSMTVPILDEITGRPVMDQKMAHDISQFLVKFAAPAPSFAAAAADHPFAGDPSPQPKAKARSRRRADDDDVQITGSNINRSQDMSFWENENSANEIKAQIMMRGVLRPIDFQFKSKEDVLKIVKDLIRQGKW
jgi:hypothetical protein